MTTTTPDVAEELDDLLRLLSAKQLASIHRSAEFTISLWVGAVSAGKTVASLFAFLLALLIAPVDVPIVIIGQTIQTIERNVLSVLENRRLFGPIVDLVSHTRGAGVARILGRDVELIGAYNAAAEGRIRGGTFGLVYVDEATLLPQAVWDMLVTRLRVSGARLIATTNPGSRNHWLRKNYILTPALHDMVTFHFTMRDNPSLELSYIRRMFRAYTGVFFERFILGLWTAAQGAIYDMFHPDRHVIAWEQLPPIRQLLAAGIDYGTSNATSVILLGLTDEYDDRGRFRPRLAAIDEFRYDSTVEDPDTGLTPRRLPPSEQSALIRSWLSSRSRIPDDNAGHGLVLRPQFTYVDPAAAEFRTQLDADRWANSTADNDVLPGIGDVASLLAQGRLIISDRCTGLLSEITEYVWDPKAQAKGEDEPRKEHDHSVDAFRYAVRSSRPFWGTLFTRAYGDVDPVMSRRRAA